MAYDSFSLAQRCKPPLDLEVFISSKAFDNSPLFYEQLEFTWLFFVLIVSSIQSCLEVGTTSGEPITLYNTAGRYFFGGFYDLRAFSHKPVCHIYRHC